MLLMLGFRRSIPTHGPPADAHDAWLQALISHPGLQLMLMMLGFRGYVPPRALQLMLMMLGFRRSFSMQGLPADANDAGLQALMSHPGPSS